MSGSEINVVSRTQVIVVEPTAPSVSVINAGPMGPGGPPGSGGGGELLWEYDSFNDLHPLVSPETFTVETTVGDLSFIGAQDVRLKALNGVIALDATDNVALYSSGAQAFLQANREVTIESETEDVTIRSSLTNVLVDSTEGGITVAANNGTITLQAENVDLQTTSTTSGVEFISAQDIRFEAENALRLLGWNLANINASNGANGAVNIVAIDDDGAINIEYAGANGSVNIGSAADIFINAARHFSLIGLPTSDPGGSNNVWNDGGTLKIT
jgi:hypothetical protein